MADEEKDLKKEDNETSTDTGQSESDDSEFEEFDDDTLIVPKSELEKINKDKENYKKGLLSMKKQQKEKKEEKKEDKEEKKEEKVKGDYVTKDEFQKSLEKDAIKKVSGEHSDLSDNWDKIVKYYFPRAGRDSVDNIANDLEDAYYLWQKKEGKEDTGEDKKAKSDIASDSGSTEKKSTGKGTKKKRKRILPKSTPIDEWYGKKEEE